jgi:anti-anti-sigma regulatory factor
VSSKSLIPEVEHIGRTLCITPHQELFFGYEPERQKAVALMRIMDRKRVFNVVIDCRYVPWGGEAFFDFLIHFWRRARTAGGQVVLCNCSEQLLELAKTLHLDMLIATRATRHEALTQLED